MGNIERKSLDEIRKEFLFNNGSYTQEDLDIIRYKILEEDKTKNPLKYKEACEKLESINNVDNDLTFEINKKQMYEFVKEKLLGLKALIIAFRMTDIELGDPVSVLNDLKMYALLYNYLTNDKELDIEEKRSRTK